MTTSKPSKRIDAFTHDDARMNIPTEELSAFVRDDEDAPKPMLYPRDPSLDPQLVWKGKDDQDREDLAVPVVPIYIQEKIHPRAIVEDIRRRSAKRGICEPAATYDQIDFFADFDGIEEFSDRIDFYQHEQHWSNRMILGDSLYVMTSLAEKEGLKGKVQTIYVDPPYGIRFGSNWQVSTRKRDVKDGSAADATRQPEQVRAFRDTWKNGIHSYLSYLRDRLTVARELLTESGSIFVQIGDENVHFARALLSEVFGAENSVSLITVRKTGGTTGKLLSGTADYILWFSKNIEVTKYRPLFLGKGEDSGYDQFEEPDGSRRRLTLEERLGRVDLPNGRRFQMTILTSPRIREARTGNFPIIFNGKEYWPTTGEWKTHRTGIERLVNAGRIGIAGSTLRYVRYLDDFPAQELTNTWTDLGGATEPVYVVQTNLEIVKRCILMTTDPGDLVLDPTCGSGTTAYVAEQWGRRWITIDTSRVALALARTRLMAGRFPYYLLADSEAGRRKEQELNPTPFFPLPSAEGRAGEGSIPSTERRAGEGSIPSTERRAGEGSVPSAHGQPDLSLSPSRRGEGRREGLRKGFVYKRVPHITLKSIANNPDIREGMTREEIDAAIARHAETEILYDQPYEDPKVVRVTGPFTVESLSPHRVLSPADEEISLSPPQRGEGRGEGSFSPSQPVERFSLSPPQRGEGQGEGIDFATMILDNLRKAGVQNTYKGERIVFDRLDPFPSRWIAARGEFTDASGESKRVAVTIGPEHGTVGREQIREAAKEAMKGVGADVLLVCGFAFDGSVAEEAKQYGNLTVLPTRMNPDLTMDELLKKTGAGNLFMVFGEPDIEIRESGDTVVVEVHGVDVYDPTTGEVRSSSTDDIACWFIDTNYNEESFFVRHAYFTGADEPYAKLKRALKAEVDEAAWASLYSTVSYPFPRPETGKIAVKVINHYGDEVLKVYEV